MAIATGSILVRSGFSHPEFAKIFTIVYLASYLSKFRLPQVDLRSMRKTPGPVDTAGDSDQVTFFPG
jgi:cell division protein FtsW (lipid II flippase)